MKAIRVHAFGDPDVLKPEEVPDPEPGPGQVRIAVKAIGVNPVETYIRAGIYGPKAFPFTPGSDGAGTIEAIGPDVTHLKPGERIYFAGAVSGAYAEKAICDRQNVYPLPEHITFAQGAAIGVPYGTAHRAFFGRGRGLPGETVLVHGATGAVGLAAVQFARANGNIVIGTGGSAEGRDLAQREGAHHVLDHHDPDYTQALMDLTGGRGVDLILEMLANVNLGTDLTLLAKRGRVVVIGSRGPVQVDARNTMARDSDIRGMSLAHATPDELTAIHAHIRAGLENRTLRPVIDCEIPLAEAARAHVEVMAGNSRGKIVLVP